MNKAQLIDELADRLGDKKTATAAVDGVVDVIVRTVNKGDKVNITGFGVFEKRARAARTARNPRTGESVRVKKTNVPAFRAGSTFKDVISGAKKLPRAAAAPKAGATARAAAGAAAGTRSAAQRSTTTRAAAAKPATTRRAAAATTTRAKAAPKATTAKAAPKATAAKKTTTAKAAAPKTAAKKAPAKRATTKK